MKYDLKFELEEDIFIVDVETEANYKTEIYIISKWYYVINKEGIFIYVEDWQEEISINECFNNIDDALIRAKEMYNTKIKSDENI